MLRRSLLLALVHTAVGAGFLGPQIVRQALLLAALPGALGAGLLHPQESESREVKSLDGLWSFQRDDASSARWAKAGLPAPMMMPVPASYNDLTQDQSLRDLVGVVWYERTVFVPLHWATQRVVLYVGSANHHARVWLNGVLVGEHEGGHLPFHLPLDPTLVAFGRASRLTIAVNNTLHATTIPPGWVQTNVAGRRVQRLQMDFFNYAGIQRQVLLYTTPLTYLDDITVSSRIDQHDAHLNVFVSAVGASSVLITLRDAEGALVTRGRMPADMRRGGRLTVSDPALWWPRYMSERPGYLYTIEVEVLGADGNVSDVYRLPHGIRTVGTRADGSFLVNGQPFYFHGFGKHEDSDVRGRGLDLPMLVKDLALYEWIGGNSMRTTHYPYSPETLQLCDQLGIVVIGEAPAVGLQNQNMVRETLLKHLDVMGELVTRDKNHPSVVMWSVANEPDSEAPSAAAYFKHLVAQTKALDPSRPVSFATFKDPAKDVATPFVDVVMVNRYYGWYGTRLGPGASHAQRHTVTALLLPLQVHQHGADRHHPLQPGEGHAHVAADVQQAGDDDRVRLRRRRRPPLRPTVCVHRGVPGRVHLAVLRDVRQAPRRPLLRR